MKRKSVKYDRRTKSSMCRKFDNKGVDSVFEGASKVTLIDEENKRELEFVFK